MSDMSNASPQAESGTTGEMGTSEETLRLDGNAAAGMLAEVFTHDMTSAQSTCANCGRVAPLGALMMYGGQIGTVLRCPACDSVEMRMVYVPEGGGQYWMDMRGISSLRIALAITVSGS
jgi:hypothetical protein